MGDSEEGGGGSVHWKLEAKKAKSANHKDVNQKVNQEGEDEDGKVGTDFTVSVLVQGQFSQEEFLIHLRKQLRLSSDKKRVYFNLPIEEKPAQIRVSWGDSKHHEGSGGNVTPALPGPGTST